MTVPYGDLRFLPYLTLLRVEIASFHLSPYVTRRKLVSVALPDSPGHISIPGPKPVSRTYGILTFRWTGVTRYAAIWSPDFPLRQYSARGKFTEAIARPTLQYSKYSRRVKSLICQLIGPAVFFPRYFDHTYIFKDPEHIQRDIVERFHRRTLHFI